MAFGSYHSHDLIHANSQLEFNVPTCPLRGCHLFCLIISLQVEDALSCAGSWARRGHQTPCPSRTDSGIFFPDLIVATELKGSHVDVIQAQSVCSPISLKRGLIICQKKSPVWVYCTIGMVVEK